MVMLTVDPLIDANWMLLLKRHRSCVFHSPAWLRVLAETYEMDIGANILLDLEGAPVAGMPFARICDARGERIVSMPFCDYCDPLVGGIEHWNVLVEALMGEHHPVALRCLHTDVPLSDSRFSEVKCARWHRIDLRAGQDALWERIEDPARRAIHKAQADGVSIRPARDLDDVRRFFELHLRVRKYKYQMIAQPFRFFERIWHHFLEAGQGVLLLAEQGSGIVGATLLLQWQDTLYYKFNASDLSHLDCRPNDLLVWEAMRWAKAHGLEWLDFGLSDWDQEGLIRFKRKFGAEEKTIHFLRCTNGSVDHPWQRNFGSMLSQLTELFTSGSTPDAVTEKAGDLLYRYFA
ncbi:MAG: GNAT family N-acetyltransferase [Anaerolineae bacterium]|nr:GNAT family N-acetyltransferase [Anaerolineae bacterium]